MLVELDVLKAWLKVRVDTSDDLLMALEERASEIVQRELRWYFGEPRETVEILDGTGTPKLFLKQMPSDGAVVMESRGGTNDAWTVMSADDYELEGRGLYARSAYIWARGMRNFRATYKEGFATPPKDIQQVVMDLVSAIWNRQGHEGFASESIGDYSYTVEDLDNLPRWTRVVNTWKRGRV